jgi:hypothetical protein
MEDLVYKLNAALDTVLTSIRVVLLGKSNVQLLKEETGWLPGSNKLVARFNGEFLIDIQLSENLRMVRFLINGGHGEVDIEGPVRDLIAEPFGVKPNEIASIILDYFYSLHPEKEGQVVPTLPNRGEYFRKIKEATIIKDMTKVNVSFEDGASEIIYFDPSVVSRIKSGDYVHKDQLGDYVFYDQKQVN